jgi:alcohol dehydrogenase class IV
MTEISFMMRTHMISGEGSFAKLPSLLAERGFSRVGVMVDGAIASQPEVDRVLDEIKTRAKGYLRVEYTLKGEPTYDYLDQVAAEFRRHMDLQAIVGLGGGSVMDTAKGVALLMTNPGEGLKYRGFPKEVNDPLPTVCIPTTAGTGSETTYNAVFIDTKEGKKLGINSVKNFPVFCVLDPKLILSCPPSVIASAGMDAVVHAVEGFVSKKATYISRGFSIRAYRLLADNLKQVKKRPGDLEVLGKLQLGAYLAIIGLANSSAGPAGGLSYLLGTWYKVPHGTAGAFFLPEVHRFNRDHGYRDYGELAGSKDVIDELFELNESLGIPRRMGDLNVPAESYERFVKGCLNDLKGAFDMNPVRMNESDIRGLLGRYYN